MTPRRSTAWLGPRRGAEMGPFLFDSVEKGISSQTNVGRNGICPALSAHTRRTGRVWRPLKIAAAAYRMGRVTKSRIEPTRPNRGHHARSATAHRGLIDEWSRRIPKLTQWGVGRAVWCAGRPTAWGRLGSARGQISPDAAAAPTEIQGPGVRNGQKNLLAKSIEPGVFSTKISMGQSNSIPGRRCVGGKALWRPLGGGRAGRSKGLLIWTPRSTNGIEDIYNRLKALVDADRMRWSPTTKASSPSRTGSLKGGGGRGRQGLGRPHGSGRLEDRRSRNEERGSKIEDR